MFFGRRKHQAARDRASAMVRDAAAAGQITTLDRDRRLQELEYAGTEAEIETFVRDLRPAQPPPEAWQTPVAPSVPPAGTPGAGVSGAAQGGQQPFTRPQLPAFAGRVAPGSQDRMDEAIQLHVERNAQPWQPRRSSHPPSFRGGFGRAPKGRMPKPGCLIVGLLVLLFFFAAPMVVGLFAFMVTTVDDDGAVGIEQVQPTPRGTPAGPSNLSRAGWEALISTFELKTGSDRVTVAVIHDDWAEFTTSRQDGGRIYTYDGDRFTEKAAGEERATESRAFSLRDVDMGGVRVGLRRAERGLDEVDRRYLHIWQREAENEPTVWAWARDGAESNTAFMSLDGEILRCDC